jgi:hypothetical protein
MEEIKRLRAERLESAEFWSLLAFPMALLIWCANILAGLLQPIIDKTHQVRGPLRYECPHSGMDYIVKMGASKIIISSSFLMVLAMTLAAFMYRCKQIKYQEVGLSAGLKTNVCQVRWKCGMEDVCIFKWVLRYAGCCVIASFYVTRQKNILDDRKHVYLARMPHGNLQMIINDYDATATLPGFSA